MRYKVLKDNWAFQHRAGTTCPRIGDEVIDPVGADKLILNGVIEPIQEKSARQPRKRRKD